MEAILTDLRNIMSVQKVTCINLAKTLLCMIFFTSVVFILSFYKNGLWFSNQLEQFYENVSDTTNVFLNDIVNNTKGWDIKKNATPSYCSVDVVARKQWSRSGRQLLLLPDCNRFKKFWMFPTTALSQEENDYPLAFVIMGYRNIEQTFRLFRAVYQPQNTYCVNWDNKSDALYQTALGSLARCFPNVLIPERQRIIKWCDYSLLQSTMDCLKVLHETPRQWKYMQILSWNDFPLKTNKEMVQIMKILNGSVDSELVEPQWHTFNFQWHLERMTDMSNPIPPHNLVVYKSSYAVTVPRDFVKFMFESKIAKDLYLWLRTSICTEEMYFSTLIHNTFLKTPGGFPGTCLQFYKDRNIEKPFISRYQIWNNKPSECHGKFTKESCVFGVGDLPSLMNTPALIGHKFYEEYEPEILFCLEQWHYEKMNEGRSITQEMVKYYLNLPSVLYHKLNEKEKDKFVC